MDNISNDNTYSIIFFLEINYLLKFWSQIVMVNEVTKMYVMSNPMEKNKNKT